MENQALAGPGSKCGEGSVSKARGRFESRAVSVT